MAVASPNLFFAPTFFAPDYFAELILLGQNATGSPDSWGTTYRDGNAFQAIRLALLSTEEFADVQIGISPAQRMGGADVTPIALVTPISWMELDDVDPIVCVRQVLYSITLIVREEDAATRFDLLDRLSCVVQNVLDGTDLGQVCIPALTKLRRGRFDTGSIHPEQSVTLNGEFSYMIPAFDGHNTDP